MSDVLENENGRIGEIDAPACAREKNAESDVGNHDDVEAKASETPSLPNPSMLASHRSAGHEFIPLHGASDIGKDGKRIGKQPLYNGVPRSRRQIIRYCQTGLLDAVKIPGPTGDQWYVAPASLPKAIGDLKQWEAQREGQGMTQLDMSSSVHPMSDRVQPEMSRDTNSDTARPSAPKLATSDLENGSVATETKVDMARHGAPKPDMSNSESGTNAGKTELVTPGRGTTDPAITSYVAQLEKRVEEKDDFIDLLKGQLTAKDEQISELSTRYRETHTLLGAMQRMIAPLLGQADPYQPADQRRDGRVDNSPPAGN